MKMRGTLLQILLAALLAVALCGCGGEEPTDETTPDANSVQQTVEEAEPNAAAPM